MLRCKHAKSQETTVCWVVRKSREFWETEDQTETCEPRVLKFLPNTNVHLTITTVNSSSAEFTVSTGSKEIGDLCCLLWLEDASGTIRGSKDHLMNLHSITRLEPFIDESRFFVYCQVFSVKCHVCDVVDDQQSDVMVERLKKEMKEQTSALNSKIESLTKKLEKTENDKNEMTQLVFLMNSKINKLTRELAKTKSQQLNQIGKPSIFNWNNWKQLQ
ncbi:hypothetical protein M3Y94_00662300 [Aphelenchoides besseyi]|nr:hypothetical protein M3Y94_00662300 [Aphelenchoides besseyi]KAI6231259.1 hypothetical protein M3Y95_00362400 [Aphelenchoides besseyi]